MEVQEVAIHPVFNCAFTSSEHPDGQYAYLGDMLGRDCLIQRYVDGWMRSYDRDGKRNEDWYGYGADVLAPFDGRVEEVYINSIINTPGIVHPSRASTIVFSRIDGVFVCYAHVSDIEVSIGNWIKAGDVVAKVGNNGYSRCPHIHVGAWKDNIPLQIRFDLQAMGRYFKVNGEEKYING